MKDTILADPASLTEFILRCREGEPSALDEFARRFGPEVERLARSILNTPEDAQDAAQEALISAVEALGKFRGDSDLRTWVFAITINACRKKIRVGQGRQRLASLLGGLLRIQSDRVPGVERVTETRLDLQSALRHMDEKHRIPMVLRYGYGLSVKEIAQVTGTGENTVLSRLFHARMKLRRILDGEEG